MTSLTSAPLKPLLDRLFAEAEQSWSSVASLTAGMADREQERLMRSKTGYADLYRLLKDQPLAISRETGTLLYMLARASRACTIVEFGTSFGISTLFLAAALRDNGGGHLITTEFEPGKAARARSNLAEAGLLDLVDIREGDALQTLCENLPETIDMVLLDGAKAIYPEILDLLESRLRPGALIIADDVDYCPDYVERVQSPAQGYMSAPLPEGVALTVRLG